MLLRQILLCFILAIALPSALMAQSGQPFVTDISFDRGLGEVRVTAMVQSDDRSMLLCTPRGILSFDGAFWDLIPTPSSPLTIAKTEDGRIYIGLKKGAAELVMNDSGTYKVKPILPAMVTESVNQIISGEGLVHFINDSRLVSYDPGSGAHTGTLEFGDRLFSGAFIQFEIPHLLFYQEGLYSYQNSTLTKIGAYARMAEYQLLFSLPSSNGTFLGFENGDLYLFDGIRPTQIGGELAKYLKENRVADGIILNDTLVAYATLSGGTVIADKRSHAIRHTLNYTTGLPDNEVTALGCDDNGGLWMAYGSGISRLDLLQPIKRFHNYPGLKGIITSTAMHQGKLYVGTGSGVFVLEETRDKAEVQRMIEEKISDRRMPAPQQEPEKVQQIQKVQPAAELKVDKEVELMQRFKENPAEVKKELSRKELRELKKKVKQGQKSANTATEETPEAEAQQPEQEPEPAKDVAEKAQVESITSPKKSSATVKQPLQTNGGEKMALFRPVVGVSSKCRQLSVINGQLYAATPAGLYLIENGKGTNLTPNIYVNRVDASRSGQRLLLATLSGVMLVDTDGSTKGGYWANDSSRVNTYNVLEDGNGDLWAGGDNMALRYRITPSGFAVKEYPINSDQLETVLVTQVDGTVHLLRPSGVQKVDPKTDQISKANLVNIPDHERLEFVLADKGMVWVHSNSGWQVLNGKGLEALLPYLQVFEDVRHLTIDDQGNLFVVEKGAELYSIRQQTTSKKEATFNVFIRKALSENRTPFALGELIVQPNENGLTFQLSAPFYLKSTSTEFQYRVEGLRDNWSRWSNNPNIDIPYLPAGSYVLHVRARNVLGETSEIRSLPFTVLKPLWLRWYAVMIYILTVIGGVFLIIKARERSLKETQRELEEKVLERTADLEREKELTESLLLNILPKETADELQKRGKATARHYNQVSVLFTDFKGFTSFAESTRPEDLVQELDRCFIAFDDIIEKYYLEKIKTIGDAYMCAGGVPIRNSNNAVAIVLAGLAIRDFMQQLEEEKKQKGERFWEIRIGINTGPLTAGVVGKKKFAYDIWGDTVNTASRMESSSEPGKINISASTYELVKDYFDCTYRGKIDAKGKGAVDMYFVNGIRDKYAVNADGCTPNDLLWQVIS
jgi:class 3 adenylate cyclase/ligand-binding sensor domain-containing protein